MAEAIIKVKEINHKDIYRSWEWGNGNIHCLSILFKNGTKKEFVMYVNRDDLINDVKKYLEKIPE
jgi:hypothetical protein